MSKIVDYIFSNYSKQDAEKLSKVKAIADLFMREDTIPEQKIRDIVDRVALFNGINKVKEL